MLLIFLKLFIFWHFFCIALWLNSYTSLIISIHLCQVKDSWNGPDDNHTPACHSFTSWGLMGQEWEVELWMQGAGSGGCWIRTSLDRSDSLICRTSCFEYQLSEWTTGVIFKQIKSPLSFSELLCCITPLPCCFYIFNRQTARHCNGAYHL